MWRVEKTTHHGMSLYLIWSCACPLLNFKNLNRVYLDKAQIGYLILSEISLVKQTAVVGWLCYLMKRILLWNLRYAFLCLMYAGMYILQYCCVLGYAILWLKILICDELWWVENATRHTVCCWIRMCYVQMWWVTFLFEKLFLLRMRCEFCRVSHALCIRDT